MTWVRVKRGFFRFRAVLVAGLLLLLAAAGVIQDGVGRAGRQVAESNDRFLDASIKSTVQLMLPIGIAKGTVDVIEGSSAVVEWGDITQPILDYLNVAWRILILSLILSTSSKYVLLGVGPLAGAFLTVSVGLYFVLAVLRLLSARVSGLAFAVKRCAGFFLLGYLLLVAILPLTLFGTARLAGTITEPLRADTARSFERVGQVFSLESITKSDKFLDKLDAVKQKAVEVIRFCGPATAEIAGSVAKLAVVKVLEGVVFPLACLAFLIWLVRGTLYPVLGLSDRPLCGEDLRKLGAYLEGGAPRAAGGGHAD